MPAASRPGSSTSGSVAPPSPAASMMITAPITGEPKIAETAAKLPAAAISASACSGASFRERASRGTRGPCRARSAAPPGRARARGRAWRARRGARRAARPAGSGAPPALSPSAGTWPPWPGRRSIASAVTSAGEREPGQRPPPRRGVVAEVARQVLVHPDLHRVDELEERPTTRPRRRGRRSRRARAARGTAGCGSAWPDRPGATRRCSSGANPSPLSSPAEPFSRPARATGTRGGGAPAQEVVPLRARQVAVRDAAGVAAQAARVDVPDDAGAVGEDRDRVLAVREERAPAAGRRRPAAASRRACPEARSQSRSFPSRARRHELACRSGL